MSLTNSDLQQIEALLDRKLKPVLGKLEAIENDVKEIYKMISDLQHSVFTNKSFSEKSVEQKILITHAEIVAIAKQAGVKLPQYEP
jgi:K+/H+ antiporter YhaU regulatory subunit KhtT